MSLSGERRKSKFACAHLLRRSSDRSRWRCWRSSEPSAQNAPRSDHNDRHRWAYSALSRSGQHRGQRSLLLELLEQDLTGDVAGFQYTSVGQRIMYFVAHALSAHHPALAQQGQMLAHLRLALAEQRDQVFDGLRPLAEQGKHFQPRRIGQRLAQLGLHAIQQLFSLSFHGYVLSVHSLYRIIE